MEAKEIKLTSDDEIEKRFNKIVEENDARHKRKQDAYVNFSKKSIGKMWLFLNDNSVQVYQFMAMGVNRQSVGIKELDSKTGEETGVIKPVHLNLDTYYNQGYLTTGMTQTYISQGTGIPRPSVGNIIKNLLKLKWIKVIGSEKIWQGGILVPVPIYAIGLTKSHPNSVPTEMFYIDLVDNPTTQIIRHRKIPEKLPK